MATQYTPTLKLALPVQGELDGTWGDVINDNITSMVEQAIAGAATINTWTANVHTLTTADGTTSEARCAVLIIQTGTGGTALTAAGEVICPTAAKVYVLRNESAYAVTLKTAAGSGIAVPAGAAAGLFCDGTNVRSSQTTLFGGTANGVLYFNGSQVASSGSALTFDGTNLATTGTASATKLIPTGGSATGNGMYLPATNALAWSNNGAETMRLDASGNLGLGVTPSAWLTTSGAKALQFAASGALFGLDVSSSDRRVGLLNNGYFNTSGFYIYSNTGAATLYQQLSGQHQWSTAASGTAGNTITFTQAMTLDASGNLGIGTASPASYGRVVSFNAGGPNWFATVSGTAQLYSGVSSGGIPSLQSNGELSFASGPSFTERMFIDASGNVGIGTVSPTTRLHVQGSGDISRLTNGTVSLYGYSDSAGLGWFTGASATGTGVYYNNTSSYQALYTGGSERMRLDASGNLGIGTTSPAFKLDVAGDIRLQTTGSKFIFASNGGAVQSGLLLDAGSTRINFYTNGTEKAVLDASGNLGIGTASPATRLHVDDGNLNGTIQLGTNATFYAQIQHDYNNAQLNIGQYGNFSGSAIRFLTVGTDRMRIDKDANLYLNTTSSGTSAAGVLSLGTGTAPTTGPADTVQLFSVDRSAGNTIPAVYCEGSGVTNAGITSTTVTHKIAMQVNGTVYYLLATTNAT